MNSQELNVRSTDRLNVLSLDEVGTQKRTLMNTW